MRKATTCRNGFDPTREDAMRIMMENTDFFIQQLREPIIMLQCDPAFVAENASQSIEYFERNTQRLGVQDMDERIALIEYEGKTYMTGFSRHWHNIKKNGISSP